MNANKFVDAPLPVLAGTGNQDPAFHASTGNEWHTPISVVPVHAGAMVYSKLGSKLSATRSPFRVGEMRLDESGMHFSGLQHVPVPWLTFLGAAGRVLGVVGYVGIQHYRPATGYTWLVSIGFISLCSVASAALGVLNERNRKPLAFTVPWPDLRELQLDKSLRFLNIAYHIPLTDSLNPKPKKWYRLSVFKGHHLTLFKMQPSAVSAVADAIGHYAPAVYRNRFKSREILIKRQRVIAVVAVLFLVAVAVSLYAVSHGII